MKFIIVFVSIVFYKFLINFINLRKCENLNKQYNEYLKTEKLEFFQEKMEIQRLFKSAGIDGGKIPFAEPTGYGQIGTGNISVMPNILNVSPQFVAVVVGLFQSSIGVYRRRMWEAFSPLYWMNTLVFLPREILGYMGLDNEKVVVKVLQIIYWFVATIFGFIYGIYKDSIDALVKGWISHLIK